jgi:hypothetical protein
MAARASLFILLILAAACQAPHVAGGTFDDGGVADSGMVNAGMPDAGMPDAGMPDAGISDAGFPACRADARAGGNCPNGMVCALDLNLDAGSYTGCTTPHYSVSDAGNVTGLVWQQDEPSDPCPSADTAGFDDGVCHRDDAQAYCQRLSLDGSGWRLPTLAELFSLVDMGNTPPMIDSIAFPKTPVFDYWTSSYNPDPFDTAWVVDFRDGSSRVTGPDSVLPLRCVR